MVQVPARPPVVPHPEPQAPSPGRPRWKQLLPESQDRHPRRGGNMFSIDIECARHHNIAPDWPTQTTPTDSDPLVRFFDIPDHDASISINVISARSPRRVRAPVGLSMNPTPNFSPLHRVGWPIGVSHSSRTVFRSVSWWYVVSPSISSLVSVCWPLLVWCGC